jgi:hypothetical protein
MPQVPIVERQTQSLPTVPATPIMPTLPKEQEKQMLEQQLRFVEAHLDAIRKRLEELSK